MSYAPTSITASKTLTRSDAGAVAVLNAAAGLTVTLPAAAGLGDVYEMVVGTTVTSNDYIISAVGSDVFTGVALNAADGGSTAVAWETAADSNTITLDGSTSGGIKGDRIVLKDVASGLWSVSIVGSATGTEATPFSNV